MNCESTIRDVHCEEEATHMYNSTHKNGNQHRTNIHACKVCSEDMFFDDLQDGARLVRVEKLPS